MENKLPVYKITISDEMNEDTGVTVVSFVSSPAIEVNFMQFSQDQSSPTTLKFSIDSEDKRIVSGPVLIPDFPIYRKDKAGDYYIYVDKENIQKIVEKFFKSNRTTNVNAEHSGLLLSGIQMFESFISDKSRGIQCPKNYSSLPDGTWYASYKVYNDEVWKQVKDGTFKGFSIEGLFDYIKTPIELKSQKSPKSDLQLLKDLEQLLTPLS